MFILAPCSPKDLAVSLSARLPEHQQAPQSGKHADGEELAKACVLGLTGDSDSAVVGNNCGL